MSPKLLCKITVSAALAASTACLAQRSSQQQQEAKSGVSTFVLKKGTLILRTYFPGDRVGQRLEIKAMTAQGLEADKTKYKAVRFEIDDEIAQLDLDEADGLVRCLSLMMVQAEKWSASSPEGEPELTFNGHDDLKITTFWTGKDAKLAVEIGNLRDGEVFLDIGQIVMLRKAVSDAIALLSTK